MANYASITEQQMREFLQAQGFVQVNLKGVGELVWAKIVRSNISMRVFSSIKDGCSREKGADAIRVAFAWRDKDGEIIPIGSTKRVHRVEGWKKNLQSRIDNWKDQLGPTCPACQAPTIQRQNKKTKQKFFGCANWSKTGCKGR